MDEIAQYYKNPNSPAYFQNVRGLYKSLKDRLGDNAPTLKTVKKFLNTEKSSYLHTPQQASRTRVKKGLSPRWMHRNSVGDLSLDCAYLKRLED